MPIVSLPVSSNKKKSKSLKKSKKPKKSKKDKKIKKLKELNDLRLPEESSDESSDYESENDNSSSEEGTELNTLKNEKSLDIPVDKIKQEIIKDTYTKLCEKIFKCSKNLSCNDNDKKIITN